VVKGETVKNDIAPGRTDNNPAWRDAYPKGYTAEVGCSVPRLTR